MRGVEVVQWRPVVIGDWSFQTGRALSVVDAPPAPRSTARTAFVERHHGAAVTCRLDTATWDVAVAVFLRGSHHWQTSHKYTRYGSFGAQIWNIFNVKSNENVRLCMDMSNCDDVATLLTKRKQKFAGSFAQIDSILCELVLVISD